MAAPLFLRGLPLRLRLQQHQRLAVSNLTNRPWCSANESTRVDHDISCGNQSTGVLCVRDRPKFPAWGDPNPKEWKAKEKMILRDINPITLLMKDILHSDRYKDGECLTAEDEKVVVDKLLAYHPHAEDKIGCGIGSIMVDRHLGFGRPRCLFVVRTDGTWIDFSFKKCIGAYIRCKYPSDAKRFIKKHIQRVRV